MFTFFLAIFSLFASAAIDIVGGQDVADSDPIFQSTVALINNENGTKRVFCTGTVIHERVVLTAAHCVQQIIEPSLFVANGQDPLKNPIHYKVQSLKYFHHHFIGRVHEVEEDIAILVTEAPMETLKAVEIGNDLFHHENAPLLQAGYGFQSFDSFNATIGKLKKLSSGQLLQIENNMIEVKQVPGAGVSPGDSGGPLFTLNPSGELILYGVLSKSIKNMDGEHKAIYTDPSAYIEWINTDAESLISIDALPAYNRTLCQKHKEGWDITKKIPMCFPATQKSCQKFSQENFGQFSWNEETQECEIRPL